jgi:DNA repair photolyase
MDNDYHNKRSFAKEVIMKKETNIRIEKETRKCGITRTGHEEKGLCQYACNTGFLCGHFCTYCSTPSILRMRIKMLGYDPFEKNLCIVDPTTPERLAYDAAHKRKRGLIELCPLVDAWAPEAQKYDLGRACLQAILSQPGWTVRVLTKNAAVQKDFDLIEKYRDRVLVGLSITAPLEKSNVISVIEPRASSIRRRMEVLREAHERGLRTYGMLCPILPGIADSFDQIEELVQFVVECNVEEIFIEPVNPRGRGLKLTQEALSGSGYDDEANAIENIRKRNSWSRYVTGLVSRVQKNIRKQYDINRLRFLLYPSRLMEEHVAEIKKDDAGVVWL